MSIQITVLLFVTITLLAASPINANPIRADNETTKEAGTVTASPSPIIDSEFGELLERMTAYDNNLSDKIRYQKRAIQSGGENVAPNFCINQPCGWALYHPSTPQIETFVRNVCSCPDHTYKCIRTDDDLSLSAYFYRCRQNTTADDIEAPEE